VLRRPERPKPRRATVRLVCVGAALAAVVGGVVGVGLGTGAAVASPSAVSAPIDPTPPSVVLVGTGGIQAADVSAAATPHLWKALGTVAPGNLVVRSVGPSTCPADGWLAVSTGRRAGDASDKVQPACRTLAEPGADGQVPAWAEYTQAVGHQDYDADLGTLGDAVAAGGVDATSIGPGAAIALADDQGQVVGDHVALPSTATALGAAVTDALDASRLVVVDVGALEDQPTTGRPAPESVRALDDRIGAVLAAVAASPTAATTDVIVASLADSSASPQLQLVLGAGPQLDTSTSSSLDGTGMLASSSTRQPGMLQSTDLLTTVTRFLGIDGHVPDDAAVGSVITTADAGATGTARLDALVDTNLHATAVRPLIAGFYLALILANLALYAFVTVVLRLDARRLGALARWLRAHPYGVLRGLVAVGIGLGSVPVATTLANLVPWWRASSPGWAVLGVVLAWVVLITVVAMLVPWRRAPLWPFGVVGGVTAVVLAADAVNGAGLQLSGLMGTQPLVAGRFYGINNTSFALFATACVMLAVALANPLVLQGRRVAAASVVAGIGIVATAIDGLPGVGADFGGPPGLVAGFAILALLAAGVRLTWRRILAVLAGAAVVVVGFALADWLRPADQRTHLGRFVDDVLHGHLGDTVGRKLGQNLHTLTNTLTLVVIAGSLVVIYVLGRPLRGVLAQPAGGPLGWITADTPLRQLTTRAPMLNPGILAAAIVLGIGFLVNDSGILIPATGFILALPVLFAVCANWLREVRPRGADAPRPPSDAPVAR
jgi:hypothetical protein